MMLYNAKKAIILKIVYVAFLATGTVFTLGFSVFNLSLYQIGKVFGTLSLSCLTLQLWMGARVRLLERGIGLDTILRWHSTNGRLTFLFMLLHPTFLFVPLLFRGMSLQALVSFFNVYHVLGITALLLTIFTIIVTVYQKELKLNYEHWKIIHKVGYVIIILGFAHSFFVGTDIIFRRPLYYWWIGLSILALSAVLYRYGARRWLLRKSMYETMKIVKENEHVRSIYLEPLRGKIFSYAPGQFAFVRFYTQRLSSEEHHFTISSSPLHNPLCFTVKESGDFTSQLDQLKKGDKAKIEGPFGTFSWEDSLTNAVFLAGGVGIAPVMSMLNYLSQQKINLKRFCCIQLKPERIWYFMMS